MPLYRIEFRMQVFVEAESEDAIEEIDYTEAEFMEITEIEEVSESNLDMLWDKNSYE